MRNYDKEPIILIDKSHKYLKSVVYVGVFTLLIMFGTFYFEVWFIENNKDFSILLSGILLVISAALLMRKDANQHKNSYIVFYNNEINFINSDKKIRIKLFRIFEIERIVGYPFFRKPLNIFQKILVSIVAISYMVVYPFMVLPLPIAWAFLISVIIFCFYTKFGF